MEKRSAKPSATAVPLPSHRRPTAVDAGLLQYQNKKTGRLILIVRRSANGKGRHIFYKAVVGTAKPYRIGLDLFWKKFDRAFDVQAST